MALPCTTTLVTFLFWTPTIAKYVSKWSDFQEKLIEIFPTSCTCFLGWFLFQLTAKANQPNGWKRYIFLDWNNQKHSLALVVQCSPRNGNPRYLHELIQNRDLKRKSLKFLDNIQHDRWKVSPIACLRIIQSHVPRMNSDSSSELLMCARAYFCTSVCRKGIYDEKFRPCQPVSKQKLILWLVERSIFQAFWKANSCT